MATTGPNYPSPGENDPSKEQLQLETLATSIKAMATADHSHSIKVATDAHDTDVRCLASNQKFPEESLVYQLHGIYEAGFNYIPAHTLVGPGGIEFTNPETFAMRTLTFQEDEELGEIGVSRTVLLTRNSTGTLQAFESESDNLTITDQHPTKSFFIDFLQTSDEMPDVYPFVELSTTESERLLLQTVADQAREFLPEPRTVNRYLRYSDLFTASIAREMHSLEELEISLDRQGASQATLNRLLEMQDLAGNDLEKDDGVILANRFKQFLDLTPEESALLAHEYREAAQQPAEDSWLARHPHLAAADLANPAELKIVLAELSRDPSAPGITYELDNPAHQLEAIWELMRRIVRRTPNDIRTELRLDHRFTSIFENNMKQEGIYDSVRPAHRELLTQEAAIGLQKILRNEALFSEGQPDEPDQDNGSQ